MIKVKMKKIVASAIAVANILMATPINVYAKWKELDNDHYGYIENNELYKGWRLLDYTCLYKGEGLSEDSSVEKAWYYFDENGIMKTDSWVKSGDKWFYLDSNGAMIKDCIKNGYAFGKDGAWIPGAGWRQFDYTGRHNHTNSQKDDYMNKAWYYFDENGIMKTNSWVKSGDKWYYLRDDGSMAKNCFIDGYPIDMYGAWISDGGWKKDNNGWWFSYGSGKGYAVDWKAFEDPYFDVCDDKTFDNGYINYYFGRDGYMKTGWIQSDGKWYYLNEDGKMAKNTSINGYILGEDGAWIEKIGQVNYTQDFVTVPEKSVYPLGTKNVNYYVINNTGNVYTYMVWASSLEKYEDNKWVRLTNKSLEELLEYMKENPDFCLGEDYRTIYKVYSSNIDLTDFKEFDSSKPGKYRIPFDGGKDADNMYVEFEIK